MLPANNAFVAGDMRRRAAETQTAKGNVVVYNRSKSILLLSEIAEK